MVRSEQEELQEFCESLQARIDDAASPEEGVELFREEAFTQLLIDQLAEAGDLEEAEVAPYRKYKVNGYGFNVEEGRLDLLNCIYRGLRHPGSVSRSDILQALKRMAAFVETCLQGLYTSLEEASPAFDMARRIYKERERLLQVNLFVLTDGVFDGQCPEGPSVASITPQAQVWDLRRLYRLESSGREREPITVDFEEFGGAIPCLSRTSEDYQAFVAILPAEVLAKVYERFGPRLLERNVRSYLQGRGKVNKGIRETILKSPSRFLAFNNGIAVTADAIVLRKTSSGNGSVAGHEIRSLTDFQIVNGGQTTATIFQAWKRDKASLGDVYVQAKISIVDAQRVNELVPLISRFANSQNKISDTDFFANEPYHVQLEKMSRTVWTPRLSGGTQETRWFYERARGQYLDALGRCSTAREQKKFKDTHPVQQKFTKTDLAKFLNTWDCLPHHVSFGAEKNFTRFCERNKLISAVVHKHYFHHVIAAAIVFRATEKIVQARKFGGYKANIVTYTVSWLRHRHPELFEVESIWRRQRISPGQASIVETVCRAVHAEIIRAASGRNVSEWCKKEDCWKSILALEIPLPSELLEGAIEKPTDLSADELKWFNERDAAYWLALMEWCDAHAAFDPSISSLLYDVAQSHGRHVPPRHMSEAVETYRKAVSLGYPGG